MFKLLIVVLTLFTGAIHASTQNEIDHLLNYVETTQCKYERNGTNHNGVDAVAHINKKYKYFKDDIKTAEDFIKYSATKSTMSGKHYKIHCEGSDSVDSKDWLLKELANYRAKQE